MANHSKAWGVKLILLVIKILWKLNVEDISMDRFLMDNFIEKRKYKRIELGKEKYKEIVTPYIARFRVKQCEDEKTSSTDWSLVAVRNLSAGGIIFDYYKKNLNIGSILELKIDFIKSTPTINCIGRVIRIEDAHANAMFRIATEFTEINDLEREIIDTKVEAILRKETKEASALFKKRYLFRRTIENEKYALTRRQGITEAKLEGSKPLKT